MSASRTIEQMQLQLESSAAHAAKVIKATKRGATGLEVWIQQACSQDSPSYGSARSGYLSPCSRSMSPRSPRQLPETAPHIFRNTTAVDDTFLSFPVEDRAATPPEPQPCSPSVVGSDATWYQRLPRYTAEPLNDFTGLSPDYSVHHELHSSHANQQARMAEIRQAIACQRERDELVQCYPDGIADPTLRGHLGLPPRPLYQSLTDVAVEERCHAWAQNVSEKHQRLREKNRRRQNKQDEQAMRRSTTRVSHRSARESVDQPAVYDRLYQKGRQQQLRRGEQQQRASVPTHSQPRYYGPSSSVGSQQANRVSVFQRLYNVRQVRPGASDKPKPSSPAESREKGWASTVRYHPGEFGPPPPLPTKVDRRLSSKFVTTKRLVEPGAETSTAVTGRHHSKSVMSCRDTVSTNLNSSAAIHAESRPSQKMSTVRAGANVTAKGGFEDGQPVDVVLPMAEADSQKTGAPELQNATQVDAKSRSSSHYTYFDGQCNQTGSRVTDNSSTSSCGIGLLDSAAHKGDFERPPCYIEALDTDEESSQCELHARVEVDEQTRSLRSSEVSLDADDPFAMIEALLEDSDITPSELNSCKSSQQNDHVSDDFAALEEMLTQ